MDSARTPTIMPLGGRMDWRTGYTERVSAGAQGLRLTALTDGPLSLNWQDGSLGGLVLPRGFALATDGTLYLLTRRAPWRIKCYNAAQNSFVALRGIGGKGRDARQFYHPQNIAVAGRNLYVADTGNRRTQVFLRGSLALRHVLTMPNWIPDDIAASGEWAFILDSHNGIVYRHQVEAPSLEVVFDRSSNHPHWSQIAIDRQGLIYLLDKTDASHPHLDVYDPHTQDWAKTGIDDPGEVRDRFDPPSLSLYFDRRQESQLKQGVFCLPESLARQCERRAPTQAPPSETPLVLCPPSPEPEERAQISPSRNCPPHIEMEQLFRSAARLNRIFDREGNHVNLVSDELLEPLVYEKEGTWISLGLDSRVYRCQWHLVELQLASLPPGTSIRVSTLNADETPPQDYHPDANDPLWQVCYSAGGPMQSNTSDDDPATRIPRTDDFLVQSLPGQFLWLKIELAGNQFSSPLIAGLRIHFPRQSYLTYLPAVYSDENSRGFLERFLSIIQTEWDSLEQRIETISRYFDPAAVPGENGFLETLARWVALPLENTWTEEQKRRLLMAVPKFYPQRGTLEGLRTFLQIYLQNMIGYSPDEQRDYPVLIEGFRERQRLMLSSSGQAILGESRPLWGPGQVSRLQLGVFAQPGQVRLVSVGDPQHDLFQMYAHRFRVFIPATWVRTATDEEMVRRALDTEKPAQTAYDLCLVEPRFRVGVQSTVGLDTILGEVPQAYLMCSEALQDAPASQAPRNRLGYDTVLGSRPSDAPALPIRTALQVA